MQVRTWGFPLGKLPTQEAEGVVQRTISNCGAQVKTYGSPSRGDEDKVLSSSGATF